MRAIVAVSTLVFLAASGCVHSGENRRAIPEARPIGDAVSCIPIAQIRNTRVHSDRIIDFHMTGRRVFRNELPFACSSLGFERRFAYRTPLSQLCSTDMITVLRSPRSMSGPRCGLGRFQPVELVGR